MKWSFTDKKVVVIGCDDRLGIDISAAFARLGAAVYGCGQDPVGLARLNAVAKNELLALSAQECVIQDENDLRQFFSPFASGLDVVVVNPHVPLTCKAATQVSAAEWNSALDGSFYVCWKAAVSAFPLLKLKAQSSLIFVTSSGVRHPRAENGVSVVCSAGIEAMTKTFSSEIAASKVRVNAVAVADEAFLAALGQSDPEPSFDASGAVLFLASDLSSYCTGYMLEAAGKRICHG